LGREYQQLHVRPRRRALIGIVFLRDIQFAAPLFSADYTMNIGLKKSLREARMKFMRSTGDDLGRI
jgi:hypothetical protein